MYESDTAIVHYHMTDLEITTVAIEEINKKSWGITQQFFEIHQILYEADQPKIAHINKHHSDGTAAVYFPVEKEKFYLAIYIQTTPIGDVIGVESAPDHSVYFRANSRDLSFDQLASLTTLSPTGGWNKGDKRRYGNSFHSFSSIELTPNPEPDEFANKLNSLLDFLEQDKDGIIRLVENAHGYIQVASIFHNGNTMLGGFHLDKQMISRLNALNLEIDFDIYAEGNFYK
jgi:hypothetical protein